MKFFVASIDSKIEKIDLHFLSNPDEAIIFLEKELFKLYYKDERYCKIIHGIGEGILMKKVHDFLKKQDIVEEYNLDESGGATIVIFN